VIAIVDHHGYVLAPLTVAPVNEADGVLLPEGLRELNDVARAAGIDLHGAVLNLDAGFDSKANGKGIFTAGLKPHIKANPRHRKKPKQGRPRFFDATLYQLRYTVERTFAWEDKFKRLLLRFETKQMHHLGFKLVAFTLINLRAFCGS
jgi:transposase